MNTDMIELSLVISVLGGNQIIEDRFGDLYV
jgi:hypothetical protein